MTCALSACRNALSNLDREPGQLVGGGARRCSVVAARQHDLDVGAEHPRSDHRIVRLLQHPADRRLGNVGATLREPEKRETGLRVAPECVGGAEGLLGLGQFSAEEVKLTCAAGPSTVRPYAYAR